MTIITPNFNFAGCCEEALAHYQKAFNARVECLLRYRDADKQDWSKSLTSEQLNYIYHAELFIGDQRLFMCDNLDLAITHGTGLSLTVTFDTKEEVQKAYEVMKEGSQTLYPLHSTTYSSCIVAFIDKFGVRWGLMTEQTEQ